MSVGAGKYNKRISIQVKGEGKDKDGYPIKDWQDVVKVWANVRTISAKEYFQSKQMKSEKTAQFQFRYREGLHEDMRIVYKDRNYEIESIINDNEENITLTIIGIEVI
ncbi:phage head closure protein [Pseudalkalibacillus sp. JSM 102089]|uniref:phage head closure protein n=1 Tax=Pseudalkalibacillus sp. JSM 102089 TaxID=3229856 RepID=UPI00352524FC